LVDAKTGEPISNAEVMSLPQASWADQQDTVAQYQESYKELVAYLDGLPAEELRNVPTFIRSELCAVGMTDEDGAFDLLVEVPWSVNYLGDIRLGPDRPPARDGVEVLRVDVWGTIAPILIPVSGGDWQEAPRSADGGIWATWDLGTLRVP
jgi:hypothetical protein